MFLRMIMGELRAVLIFVLEKLLWSVLQIVIRF